MLSLVALLAALALQTRSLDSIGLWFDEGVSVYLSQLSLAELTIDKNLIIDRLPPAHALLLKGWTAAAGASPYSVRWPSVAASLLTAGLAFRLVRRSGSDGAALLAMVLLLAHPLLNLHAGEARMYSIGSLLTLAATYLAGRMMSLAPQPPDQRTRPRLLWAGYVLCAATAVYTHYYFGLALAAHTLWALTRHRRGRAALPLLSAQAVAGLLVLPWGYPVFAGQWQEAYQPAPFERFGGGPWGYLQSWWLATSVGAETPTVGGWLLSLPLLAALALAGKTAASKSPSKPLYAGILLATGVLPFILAAPVLWLSDFFRPRLLIFGVPPLFAAGCLGIASLRPRQAVALGAALFLSLVAVPALGWGFEHERDSSAYYRELVQGNHVPLAEGDLVLSSYPWQVGYLQAYSPQPLRHYLLPKDWWQDTELAYRLAAATVGESRLWVASFDPGERFVDSLDGALPQRFSPVYTDQYGETRLRLYDSAGEAPLPVETSRADEAVFGQRVRLLKSELKAEGRGVDVALYLARQPGASPLPDYTLSLRLEGTARRWLGEDEVPLRGSHPTSQWGEREVVVHRQRLTLPAEAPSGEFAVALVVYQWGQMEQLPVASGTTPDGVQHLLGTVVLR